MWFCLHFLFYFVITIFLLLQTPTNFCWMTFTCVTLSTLPLIGLTSALLPPCRNCLIVPCPFFWCQIVIWKNLVSIFLVMYFCLGFFGFQPFCVAKFMNRQPFNAPSTHIPGSDICSSTETITHYHLRDPCHHQGCAT